jgi:adenine/guanine phosphoribosyltransferase-like PRPP-binding protein
MKEHMVKRVKSITTKDVQTSALTPEDAKLIEERRICIFDDVVSTGEP